MSKNCRQLETSIHVRHTVVADAEFVVSIDRSIDERRKEKNSEWKVTEKGKMSETRVRFVRPTFGNYTIVSWLNWPLCSVLRSTCESFILQQTILSRWHRLLQIKSCRSNRWSPVISPNRISTRPFAVCWTMTLNDIPIQTRSVETISFAS